MDFNKDGKFDLAVANQVSDNVSVLLGDGQGAFGPQTTFAADPQSRSVVVGDFNGDGVSDLAVAGGSNNLSVLMGDGKGAFGPLASFGVGINSRSVAVGDFNGDGKTDLVVANQGSANVNLLLNLSR